MKYKLDGQEPVPQLKGAYCLVSQPQAWVWIMLPFKKIKINAKWMLSFNAFVSFSLFFFLFIVYFLFFIFYSYDTWILASCVHITNCISFCCICPEWILDHVCFIELNSELCIWFLMFGASCYASLMASELCVVSLRFFVGRLNYIMTQV